MFHRSLTPAKHSFTKSLRLNLFRLYFWSKLRWKKLCLFVVLSIFAIQAIGILLIWLGLIGNVQYNISPNRPISAALKSQIESEGFNPQKEVAFGIPVGGATQRAESLSLILKQLVDGGANPKNIFVFEDKLSRAGGLNSQPVAQVARQYNVRVISSQITRDDAENYTNFGIHLARHYKFMLDYLLTDETPKLVSGESGPGTKFEFAVLIEDDLELSQDFVKYFFSMSRVMRVDETLYCVSAHQDNAFFGIANDEGSAVKQLDPLQFDFRRGNHFMAPGWMTSRKIYNTIVKPQWLDETGNYKYKDRLHLKNGHWDRFFDSLIGDKDCIFPEIPRIIHQGSEGFTVSKRGQMELYSNLRLSKLSPQVSYGDLSRFSKESYIQNTLSFISSAKLLNVLEEIHLYRNTPLIYVVPALDDKDEEWNAVFNHFFGLIGVGGYGGYIGYVKVRGIFNGAVFVRWLTNLILLVGSYSPYMYAVNQLPAVDDSLSSITHAGCYVDGPDRDLAQQITHYTKTTLTVRKCLASCQLLGYKYAGLQLGSECWCGNSMGKHHSAQSPDECNMQCSTRTTSTLLLGKQLVPTAHLNRESPINCGGGYRNNIYFSDQPSTPKLYKTVHTPPTDVSYVQGEIGQSCDDVCQNLLTPSKCDERYFPLIHRSCSILSNIFKSKCTKGCYDEEDVERGFATPFIEDNRCFFSRARYHRCNYKPIGHMRRACVCISATTLKHPL